VQRVKQDNSIARLRSGGLHVKVQRSMKSEGGCWCFCRETADCGLS
jgi:hypothetical protein